MNPDHFVKVFDVLDSGYKDWSFAAFGLIFVVAGIVVAAFPIIIKAAGIPFLENQSRFRKISRYAMLAFAVLWTVVVFSATYTQYMRHKSLAQQGGCRVVEGPVERFVPMPYTGHAVESFFVSGVPFIYSDFIVTDGFNNTSSHGGPIRNDSYVRICYDPAGNVILRLEIRDFKGELKDYGRDTSFFPKPQSLEAVADRKLPTPFPWYGNLIVVFFFLDLIAIQVLFLPYLRTFLRIKTMTVRDRVIPVEFKPGEKMKLRNCMVYWDRENHAIWLRPRGYNLLQVPWMVAKLNIGVDDRSIVGDEIRFSSGFPLFLILFLWTVYQLFSAIELDGAKGAHLPCWRASASL
jgi:hypothetical protein